MSPALLTRRLWLFAATAPLVAENSPRWTLAGRTVDSEGRPIAWATVTLDDMLTKARRTVRSDRNGWFQFQRLIAGVSYEVRAKSGNAASKTIRLQPIIARRVVLIELRLEFIAAD